nr:MAG TPA: hypothetical protein [Caudoviricetes sp.]
MWWLRSFDFTLMVLRAIRLKRYLLSKLIQKILICFGK